MEHPFFPTTTTRVEALRWLSIAEKLLLTRDFVGSKSFAARARDSDPTFTPADQILAVANTLIAGTNTNSNNHPDWYAVLDLTPQQGRDMEVVASRYRSLASILNPQKNRFPLADEALRLVVDAWSVLSNPSRKSAFDKEIANNLQSQQQQQQDQFSNPVHGMHQNLVFYAGTAHSSQSVQFPQVYTAAQVEPVSSNSVRDPSNFMNFASGSTLSFGGSKAANEAVSKQQKQEGNSTFGSTPSVDEENNFWTACPYCYYMYEYPALYVDCTLKCQHCKRAFQGIVIPSPPSIQDGKDGFFSCWGFLPLGFSSENWEKSRGAGSTWTPFSPMFSCPTSWNGSKETKQAQARKKRSAPGIYVDDDEDDQVVMGGLSDESDDGDWNGASDTNNKKHETVKRKKGVSKAPNRTEKKVKPDKDSHVNVPDAAVTPTATPNKKAGESSKKGPGVNGRKQPGRVAKNCGKLDLNVEFSNEAEEPAPKVGEPQPGPSRGDDDNIEGIGFFEGLDEFLSSLPILNIVADDKVVKAA